MNIESLIAEFSYAGILLLMSANGVISFPSSQILYIIVGYFVGAGKLALIPAIIAGAIGNTIGNIILYEIVRKKGEAAALKYLPLTPDHVKRLESFFKKRGLIFLFIAKLTPALKTFVPIAAGIAKVPRPAFAIIILTSSLVWAGAFMALGYYFGANPAIWEQYSKALIVIAIFVTIFAYRGFKNETK